MYRTVPFLWIPCMYKIQTKTRKASNFMLWIKCVIFTYYTRRSLGCIPVHVQQYVTGKVCSTSTTVRIFFICCLCIVTGTHVFRKGVDKVKHKNVIRNINEALYGKVRSTQYKTAYRIILLHSCALYMLCGIYCRVTHRKGALRVLRMGVLTSYRTYT